MLRDVQESDLPILFEYQSVPEAYRMAAFEPRDHDAFMLHWRTKILGDDAVLKKVIVVDGAVVGNIGSWDQDDKRLVGYWLGPAAWGRGLATAGLSEFLLAEPIRPLFAHVAVANRGSIRVLEKCGFRQVGVSQLGPDGVAELLFRLD